MKPIIAVVGRPNVGKSTFFNRVAGKRQAIVEDLPGVTRDRIYAECLWENRPFILVDTGGFDPGSDALLQKQIFRQVEEAIREADEIIFLLDGREGLLPADRDLADILRKSGKPVFYAVNKIDGEKQEPRILDFYSLGVEPLYPISAEHGRGVGDLLDEALKAFPPAPGQEQETDDAVRVALVGRPNVGKSSLLNKLLGRPRAIVDAKPGTTRDALDTPIVREGRKYIFIDTAGIRRKGRIHEPVEHYSVIRALKSLERADVALILLDGFEGLTEQDMRIVEMAAESGRALLILVNKWDLVEKETNTAQEYKARIHREMKTFDYVPVHFVSALTGQRVSKIFSLIDAVRQEHRKRISTGDLNRWFRETVQAQPPPLHRNRPVKLLFITQAGTAPPAFVIFASDPRGVTESYQRYLRNRLREKFGFAGTPLRLRFRQRRKGKTGSS
jgi:GTP-binding protein